MLRTLILIGAVAIAASGAKAHAAGSTEDPSVALGHIIAQRHCATCHALTDGKSPLGDAPAFPRLGERYGAGGLPELLERGMIKDWPRPLEEGQRMLHPRMPAFRLDGDEVAALTAYLRSIERR